MSSYIIYELFFLYISVIKEDVMMHGIRCLLVP
jgi:hypothetical protein